MRNKFLLLAMFLLLLVGISSAQTPTFTCTVQNQTISADGKIFTMDIYLTRTGTDMFELFAFQGGFLFDNAVKNGGTTVATWVAGSQNAMNANQRGATFSMATAGCLKIAPQMASGFGTGTIIPVAPGIKYGTVQIVNTVQFLHDSLKLAYSWNVVPYATKVSCYDQTTTFITDNTTSGTFNINTPLLVLPVELSSFAYTSQGRTVVLNWSTKTEKNSDRFEVQRSLVSNSAWSTVGTVKAADLSNSQKQYSYTDKNLQSCKYQYRLKMIDNDGTFEYSKVIEVEIAIPKVFELSQNYPNPFNPNTVISYSLPSSSIVKLVIYNSLGQTVKVLENGFKIAGTYSVNFNASELSSGTYFYKIEAGQFSQIKKMILLK